eukprot:jgi/Botrbrau1/9019/Bobra.0148s0119.1
MLQQAAPAWRIGFVLLGLALLCGVSAEETKALSGAELDKKVEENIENQDYLREKGTQVIAQIIKQEPQAEIASGTGDVSVTEGCSDDVDTFCPEVKPGEGRMAKCFGDQLAEEAKKDYNNEKKLSAECKKELDAFLKGRSENINKDLPLAKACLGDVEKLCANIQNEMSVLACLRQNKEKLSTGCSDEVFQRQQVAVDDWRTDKELFTACKGEVEKHCPDVEPHEGKVQACLGEKEDKLDWDCRAELFRQQTENADDMRLSIRLFRACLGDKRKFCADVPPGNTRAKDCLEEHRDDDGFSKPCKDEIEKMMSERAADFRLDYKLRESCSDDIDELCEYEVAENVADTRSRDAPVIKCLQDYRDSIQNPACKSRVLKMMEFASSDIRFDVALAQACYEDRMGLCGSIPPGSARVIRCLQDQRALLQEDCKAVLFDQEVVMSESIDFQYDMKKNCTAEMSKFCKDVAHGRAKVIRCLEDNMEKPEFGPNCKTAVQKHIQHSAQDYRLNHRLSVACKDTIDVNCSDLCPFSEGEVCGGRVLRCLTDIQENITNADCKKEVFYFMKMEVKDFRNDVLLAEACRQDVETFCAKIEPGEGRVLNCLHENRPKLSPTCRKEEIAISLMQSSNVELLPSLGAACKEERKENCADVRPGRARVLNCLLTNAEKSYYSRTCREQLGRQVERRVKDWRLDYDLRNACREDVGKVCAEARKTEDDDQSGVLKCLVKTATAGEATLAPACAREVGRAARTALQFYQAKMPLTDVCDSDVLSSCSKGKELDQASVGEIRQCLSALTIKPAAEVPVPKTEEEKATSEKVTRHLLEQKKEVQTLSPNCAALVVLSEPEDAFKAYESSMTLAFVSQNVKGLEKAWNLKEGTLTRKVAGQTTLTLTGWSAVCGILSVVILTFSAAIWGYCKYRGLDKMSGYTMVIKGKAPTGA